MAILNTENLDYPIIPSHPQNMRPRDVHVVNPRQPTPSGFLLKDDVRYRGLVHRDAEAEVGDEVVEPGCLEPGVSFPSLEEDGQISRCYHVKMGNRGERSLGLRRLTRLRNNKPLCLVGPFSGTTGEHCCSINYAIIT